MKELDALINALNERRIPEAIKKIIKIVPLPKDKDTTEKKQALINKVVKGILASQFEEHEELMNLFASYSYELGMNALIKELDIKAPEDDSVIDKFLELLKNL